MVSTLWVNTKFMVLATCCSTLAVEERFLTVPAGVLLSDTLRDNELPSD